MGWVGRGQEQDLAKISNKTKFMPDTLLSPSISSHTLQFGYSYPTCLSSQRTSDATIINYLAQQTVKLFRPAVCHYEGSRFSEVNEGCLSFSHIKALLIFITLKMSSPITELQAEG
jgi:hypothetical protein